MLLRNARCMRSDTGGIRARGISVFKDVKKRECCLHCISPVTLLHQPLSLLLAGVLLSFVGMEKDLQGRRTPLEPVPPSFPHLLLFIPRCDAMFGIGKFWKKMVLVFFFWPQSPRGLIFDECVKMCACVKCDQWVKAETLFSAAPHLLRYSRWLISPCFFTYQLYRDALFWFFMGVPLLRCWERWDWLSPVDSTTSL